MLSSFNHFSSTLKYFLNISDDKISLAGLIYIFCLVVEASSKHGVMIPRIKFSEEEKRAIRIFFKKHIKMKQSPKKMEVLKFMNDNKNLFQYKNWVKVKAFVYNEYRLR